MAWTHIASAIAQSTSAPIINSSGANFLIAVIRYYGSSSGFRNIGSSTANSWTIVGSTQDFNGQKVDVYVCDNPAYTGANTGVAGDIGYFACSLAAFSRPAGTLTTSSKVVAQGAGTSLSTGSITPAANDALLITWLSYNGDIAIPTGVPSGYGDGGRIASSNSAGYGGGLGYLNQATAAAENPSWSVPSSTDMIVGIVAFTVGDTTAPTLSSPSGAGGALSCSGSVSTNEGNGTLYVSFTASATVPTAVQVEAGQDHSGAAALRAVSQTVTATGTQSIGSGSITAGTRYAHFMHKDAAGNRSTVSSSAGFTVTSGGGSVTTPYFSHLIQPRG